MIPWFEGDVPPIEAAESPSLEMKFNTHLDAFLRNLL